MIGRLYSFSHDKAVVKNVFWKNGLVKEDIKETKIHSYIKHYIKMWRLLLDVSHLERG